MLIPRFGAMGAAWATVLAYAVMAVLGHAFSRRVFPIPFEGGRLARITAAAGIAYALSTLVRGRGHGGGDRGGRLALLAYPVAAGLLGTLRPDEAAASPSYIRIEGLIADH